MAIQTRYAGDANGVLNVDSGVGSLGQVIATGLTKNPTLISVVPGSGQSFVSSDMAVGGSVETLLRSIAVDSTIVMYQVNTGSLSVYLEASGAGGATGNNEYGAAVDTSATVAAALQTRINTLTANIGNGTGNIWANTATVVGSVNFKLATA